MPWPTFCSVDYNPSGKLPMSFPRTEGQIPIYYDHFNTGRPAKSDDEINYRFGLYRSSEQPAFSLWLWIKLYSFPIWRPFVEQ